MQAVCQIYLAVNVARRSAVMLEITTAERRATLKQAFGPAKGYTKKPRLGESCDYLYDNLAVACNLRALAVCSNVDVQILSPLGIESP